MDYTPEDKQAFVEHMLALPEIARSRTDPMGIMSNVEFANSLREDFPELPGDQVGWFLSRLADTVMLIAARGGPTTSVAVAFISLAVEFLDPLEVPEEVAGFMAINEAFREQQVAVAKAERERAMADHPAESGDILGSDGEAVVTDEELESWLFGDIDEEPVTGDVEIQGPVAEGHIGTPEDDES